MSLPDIIPRETIRENTRTEKNINSTKPTPF